MPRLLPFTIFLSAGLALASAAAEGKMADTTNVPFDYVANSLIIVPVTLNETVSARFLVDTGAGIEILSAGLCAKLGCKTAGTIRGQRMTGEVAELQRSQVGALTLGTYSQRDVVVGVSKIFDALPPELGRIDGALSLKFFASQPFTIDFARHLLTLETTSSLAQISRSLTAIGLTKKSQVPATLGVFAPVTVTASGRTLHGAFEIDTGNTLTVINADSAKDLGIDLAAATVVTKQGKNETGHDFKRHYAKLAGAVTLVDQAVAAEQNPRVCFEKIIYDGVLGNAFFQGRRATFDLPRARLFVTPVSP